MTNRVYRRAYGFRSKSATVINNRRAAGRKLIAKLASKNRCKL